MNINEEIERDLHNGEHRLKNEILADKICRLLFGDSTDLLDEIFAHPLSIDYFNVYLSLPVFGQRVLYQQTTDQFDFDPPLLSSSNDQNVEQIKAWLINYRLNDYIQTDIYIESLLGLLLARVDDNPKPSVKSYTFFGSNEMKVEQLTYVFSTVNDVRQFHQFLQSNLGMKYWDFFIDSMRLLRSRRSTPTTRIDISSLNFIYKYNSRKAQFHSIVLDPNKPSMPHSGTPDSECFRMAVNAMEQLHVYWLPRFLSEIPLSSLSKRKRRTIDQNPNQTDIAPPAASKTSIEIPSIDLPKVAPTVKAIGFVKHRIGNISYLDYSPQECLFIQSSDPNDAEEDTDSFNQLDKLDPVESDLKLEPEKILPVYSGRSLEDYANNDNLELFYRIFVSDFLAGSPFGQYTFHTNAKTEGILHQTCLRFIIDAEILCSIPSGRFQERILRQFILRYLHVTATEEFPSQIQQLIEEQRTELITELTTNDQKSYPQLSKLLLDVTKFLIPHFLDYVKYDRLRFLLQGKASNPMLILDDLHRIVPSMNFEPTLIDRLQNKTLGHESGDSNGKEFDTQLTLTLCGGQQDDLINPLIKTPWMTTEKLLNTDEQCAFQTGEHLPPLTDIELQEELNQYCTKFQWTDIQNILGTAFHVSITSHPSDHTTFIDHQSLPSKLYQTSISDQEQSPLNAIELFTLDILQSARETVEIDCFVRNIMDEGLNLFRTNTSLNPTPLSPVFEEILFTDSSSTITSKSILNTTNNNAIDIHHFEKDDRSTLFHPKILSSMGSYFINTPNQMPSNDQLHNPSTFNPQSTNFFREIIRFARKDASNEVKNLPFNQGIFQGPHDDQQQLLELIHQEILHHPWPLEEYRGSKQPRTWHAFKLASRISNLDDGLMLNDHQSFDWIVFDDNLDSFGE